jgi:hypothetical protein
MLTLGGRSAVVGGPRLIYVWSELKASATELGSTRYRSVVREAFDL